MKFFIDTANLDQIKEANDLGILDGVTTNPSLMAKEGIKGLDAVIDHYKTICEMVNGDISAEVVSTDFKTIIEEGQKFAGIHKNIVVKVPMIKEGVKAIKWFTDNSIRTNCTLVFSAGQAILAAKAGAAYVSPFIGRIDDGGWDGLELIEQIARIFDVQGYSTEILAASIRIEAARLLCLRAAWEKDQNQDYTLSAAMAKVYASETAMWVATEAVQIHGGYGFVKEYHVERMMRDAKITQIYEGTSEVQRIVIGRSILK